MILGARDGQKQPALSSSLPTPLAPPAAAHRSNNALYSYAAGVYSPVVSADAYEDHALTLVGYTDMWVNATTSLPVWIIKNRHAGWGWGWGWGVVVAGLPALRQQMLHVTPPPSQLCFPSSPCHPVSAAGAPPGV